MTTNVLFAGQTDQWPTYQPCLKASFERLGVDANLFTHTDDPAAIDYIIYAPNSGLSDFSPFTRLKAVLSLWAGVESFQDNMTLSAPLARMVDEGLTRGMVEWVLGHVMRYHLGLDGHVLHQDGVWRGGIAPPLAHQRTVGILGLGALGMACGEALSNVGFNVCGWARRLKASPHIACHSGKEGLTATLAQSNILVLLLPLTSQTENVLNAKALALMPKGAVLLNPGRGGLIDDEALFSAIDTGHISHATLDVFRKEPLPASHPYWHSPAVTVTPHIASETRPETASDAIAENIRRGESGEDFINLVDRKLGY